MITAGRVHVNGELATLLGTRVRPDLDEVRVDGVVVHSEPLRWAKLNKPMGVLTTRRDPQGRRTVYDLLPESLHGLSYVGRLDRETEGLLLFTNDGDHAHALLHPGRGVEREYRASVRGEPSRAVLGRLTRGVELADGPARAARARILQRDPGRTLLGLVLTEGRNREVRRLCKAVGHPVEHLERVRFGPVRLGDVPRGEWRQLGDGEVNALRQASGVLPTLRAE